MKYTREEYENLINNNAFFRINQQPDAFDYNTEKFAFMSILAEYYSEYILKETMSFYGLEFIETATSCVLSYSSEKGEFLHYFNVSLKKKLSVAKAKNKQDKVRKGLVLVKKEEALIRKILTYAKSKNVDLNTQKGISQVAVLLQLSEKEVIDLLHVNRDAVALRSTVKNNEDEKVELFDTVLSKIASPEDNLVCYEGVSELIGRIDTIYSELQKRETQRRLVGMWLTAEIIKNLAKDFEKFKDEVIQAKFFNKEIAEKYFQEQKIVSKTEIAKLCGVSLQSASRTISEFESFLKEKAGKISS